MQSEFNKGAAYMRDIIVSHIIGIQNDLGNNIEDKGYQELQKLLELIEDQYGKMCEDFMGWIH